MNTICKKQSDLKKIFKTLTEDNGLLDRRLYKVPVALKNITDIEFEEINKKPYYIIQLARELPDNDKRYIIVMIMNDIQLLNEKKKNLSVLNILKIFKILKKPLL